MAKWEKAIGYPDYLVSDEGEIKKIESDGTLSNVKKRFDKFGFQVVDLIKPSGIKTEVVVARLVAELFTPLYIYEEEIPPDAWNPYTQDAVSHKDGDLGNNHIDNLKWVDALDDPDDELRRVYVKSHTKFKTKPGKKVYCRNVETGELYEFDSQKEAEEVLGVKNIAQVLNGNRKRAGCYEFWR